MLEHKVSKLWWHYRDEHPVSLGEARWCVWAGGWYPSRQKEPTCTSLPALHNHLGTGLQFPELLFPETRLVDLEQGGPSLCNKREQGREGLSVGPQPQVKGYFKNPRFSGHGNSVSIRSSKSLLQSFFFFLNIHKFSTTDTQCKKASQPKMLFS